ncbi:hypothetical protein FQA47_000646 [Oryzias melastigma]|uniref:Uncharacterized protein n=1 Tax=Oryzias melastigma TaxID=30732 RepID=A0A834BYY5_ORYME|nr:hypothetical protein FQA47_000646 [Oryzias melastigma]
MNLISYNHQLLHMQPAESLTSNLNATSCLRRRSAVCLNEASSAERRSSPEEPAGALLFPACSSRRRRLCVVSSVLLCQTGFVSGMHCNFHVTQQCMLGNRAAKHVASNFTTGGAETG